MPGYQDIARLWAAQSEKGIKRAGNFWRRDRIAGHFRSAIAAMVTGPDGKPIALIWDSHWGGGTTAMLNACEGEAKKLGILTFRVPNILEKTDHRENLDFYERAAQECEEKIARARSVDWQAQADKVRAKAEEYRKAFGLE